MTATDVLHLDRLLTAAVICEVADHRPGPRAQRWEVVIGDPDRLARLRLLLTGTRGLTGECACSGEITLRFFDVRGGVLSTIVLHMTALLQQAAHAAVAGAADMQSDRVHALLDFLAGQGLPGPLERMQEAQRRAVEAAAQWQDAVARWQRSAPAAVHPLMGQMLETSTSGSVSRQLRGQLHAALAAAVPDPQHRALVLLRWSRSRPGRYGHEDIPELLVRDVPVATLLSALWRCPDTDPAWAAAAEHFATWKSRTAEELLAVPLLARRRLLLAAENAGDINTQRRLPGKWADGS